MFNWPRRRPWRWLNVYAACAATATSALAARIQNFMWFAPGIESDCVCCPRARLIPRDGFWERAGLSPRALHALCHVAECCGKNYNAHRRFFLKFDRADPAARARALSDDDGEVREGREERCGRRGPWRFRRGGSQDLPIRRHPQDPDAQVGHPLPFLGNRGGDA